MGHFGHVMSKSCHYATNDNKIGGWDEKTQLYGSLIYLIENNSINQKVQQRHVGMEISLQGGWFKGKKTNNTSKNQVHFQSCFVSRYIGIFYNH